MTSGKRSTRNLSLPPPYNTDRFARALHLPSDSSNMAKAGNTAPKQTVSDVLCASVLRSDQLSKISSDTPTQSFWNLDRAYMRANTGGGRSGLNSNTVLASIHTFDPSAGCDSATFQPCSDLALSNLKKYVDSFRRVYALNKGAHAPDPIATGRYPEDVYFGGNVRT